MENENSPLQLLTMCFGSNDPYTFGSIKWWPPIPFLIIFHLIIELQMQLFDEESPLYFWSLLGPEIPVELPSRSFDLTGWRGMSGFRSQPPYSTVSPRQRAAKAALWRGNTVLCAQTLSHGHKTVKSGGWEAHRVSWSRVSLPFTGHPFVRRFLIHFLSDSHR